MRTTLATALLLVTSTILLAAGAAARPPRRPPSHVGSAYFADWDRYGRGYLVKQIPADQINVIHYAFAFSTPTGCGLSDPWADYQRRLDRRNTVDGVADDPANPTSICSATSTSCEAQGRAPGPQGRDLVGGWTKSTWFSDAAATPDSRAAFAASCIDPSSRATCRGAAGRAGRRRRRCGRTVRRHRPRLGVPDPARHGAQHSPDRPAQRDAAAAGFRRHSTNGRRPAEHYLLTAAIPGGNIHSTGSWELSQVAKNVDWIDLMSFDYHGSWDAITAFNSPFGVSTRPSQPVGGGAVQWTWSTAGLRRRASSLNGVPASKLVVGVPFYGKEYTGVGPANHGLYQPHGAVTRVTTARRTTISSTPGSQTPT